MSLDANGNVLEFRDDKNTVTLVSPVPAEAPYFIANEIDFRPNHSLKTSHPISFSLVSTNTSVPYDFALTFGIDVRSVATTQNFLSTGSNFNIDILPTLSSSNGTTSALVGSIQATFPSNSTLRSPETCMGSHSIYSLIVRSSDLGSGRVYSGAWFKDGVQMGGDESTSTADSSTQNAFTLIKEADLASINNYGQGSNVTIGSDTFSGYVSSFVVHQGSLDSAAIDAVVSDLYYSLGAAQLRGVGICGDDNLQGSEECDGTSGCACNCKLMCPSFPEADFDNLGFVVKSLPSTNDPGSEAVVECDATKGLSAPQNTPDSSKLVICTGGVWRQPAVACRPVCPALSVAVASGQFAAQGYEVRSSNSTDAAVDGDTGELACSSGYLPPFENQQIEDRSALQSNTTEVTCQGGKWTTPAFQCRKTCPTPFVPPTVNGETAFSVLSQPASPALHYESTLISCETGFSSVSLTHVASLTSEGAPADLIHCIDGTWTKMSLSCERSCDPFGKLDASFQASLVSSASANKTATSTTDDFPSVPGTQVQVTCSSGYAAPRGANSSTKSALASSSNSTSTANSASQTLTCRSGVWSTLTLDCLPLCEPYTVPSGLVVSSSLSSNLTAEVARSRGSKLTLQCPSGYASRSGQTSYEITCGVQGWSTPYLSCAPLCEAFNSTSVGISSNSTITDDQNFQGSSLPISCDASAGTSGYDYPSVYSNVPLSSASKLKDSMEAVCGSDGFWLGPKLSDSCKAKCKAFTTVGVDMGWLESRNVQIRGETTTRKNFEALDALAAAVRSDLDIGKDDVALDVSTSNSQIIASNSINSTVVVSTSNSTLDVMPPSEAATSANSDTNNSSIVINQATTNVGNNTTYEETLNNIIVGNNTAANINSNYRRRLQQILSSNITADANNATDSVPADSQNSYSAPTNSTTTTANSTISSDIKLVSRNPLELAQSSAPQGSTLTLECMNGTFPLPGFESSQTVRCLEGGSWEAPLLKCAPPCPVLDTLGSSISIKGEGLNPGDSRTIECAADYSSSVASIVEDELICTNGAWTVPALQCKRNCASPWFLSGGQYVAVDGSWADGSVATHGTKLTIQCTTKDSSTDSAAPGTEDITCIDGTWGAVTLKCSSKCPHPRSQYVNEFNSTEAYSMVGTSSAGLSLSLDANTTTAFKDGDSVRVTCIEPYVASLPESSTQLQCLNGAWFPPKSPLSCELPCSSFPTIPASHTVTTSASNSNVRIIACASGYSPAGNGPSTAEVICTGGEWPFTDIQDVLDCSSSCQTPTAPDGMSLVFFNDQQNSTVDLTDAHIQHMIDVLSSLTFASNAPDHEGSVLDADEVETLASSTSEQEINELEAQTGVYANGTTIESESTSTSTTESDLLLTGDDVSATTTANSTIDSTVNSTDVSVSANTTTTTAEGSTRRRLMSTRLASRRSSTTLDSVVSGNSTRDVAATTVSAPEVSTSISPSLPSLIAQRKTSYSPGQSVIVTCQSDPTRSFGLTTCGKNGQWTIPPITCHNTCRSLETVWKSILAENTQAATRDEGVVSTVSDDSDDDSVAVSEVAVSNSTADLAVQDVNSTSVVTSTRRRLSRVRSDDSSSAITDSTEETAADAANIRSILASPVDASSASLTPTQATIRSLLTSPFSHLISFNSTINQFQIAPGYVMLRGNATLLTGPLPVDPYVANSTLGFPHGTSISLQCAAGYHPVTSTSTEQTLTCIDGKLTLPLLRCEPECPSFATVVPTDICPEGPSASSCALRIEGEGRTPGSRRSVSCASGFSPRHNVNSITESTAADKADTSVCLGGQWSTLSVDCVPDCATPAPPDGMEFSSDLPSVLRQGTKLKVACKSGFSTTFATGPTSAEIVCLDGGVWSHTALACYEDCSPGTSIPSLLDNTRFDDDSTADNSTSSFAQGWHSGSGKVIDCPFITSTIVNGTDSAASSTSDISNATTNATTTITTSAVVDVSSLFSSEHDVLFCRKDKPLFTTPTHPCRSLCPLYSPPADNNVILSAQESLRAVVECKPGYTGPVGGETKEILNCQSDGTWSSLELRCTASCDLPQNLDQILAPMADGSSASLSRGLELYINETESKAYATCRDGLLPPASFGDSSGNFKEELICVDLLWATPVLTCQTPCENLESTDSMTVQDLNLNGTVITASNEQASSASTSTLTSSNLIAHGSKKGLTCNKGYSAAEGKDKASSGNSTSTIDRVAICHYGDWVGADLSCKSDCLVSLAGTNGTDVQTAVASHGQFITISCSASESAVTRVQTTSTTVVEEGETAEETVTIQSISEENLICLDGVLQQSTLICVGDCPALDISDLDVSFNMRVISDAEMLDAQYPNVTDPVLLSEYNLKKSQLINGGVSTLNIGNQPQGSKGRVACRDGYVLSDPSAALRKYDPFTDFETLSCSSSVWDTPVTRCEPQCPPITAASTASPLDGVAVTYSPNGQVASISCMKGYFSSNPSFALASIQCLSGTWPALPLACIPRLSVLPASSAPSLIFSPIVAAAKTVRPTGSSFSAYRAAPVYNSTLNAFAYPIGDIILSSDSSDIPPVNYPLVVGNVVAPTTFVRIHPPASQALKTSAALRTAPTVSGRYDSLVDLGLNPDTLLKTALDPTVDAPLWSLPSIWKPIPPSSNYTCLGFAVSSTLQPPPKDALRCVPTSCVKSISADVLLQDPETKAERTPTVNDGFVAYSVYLPDDASLGSNVGLQALANINSVGRPFVAYAGSDSPSGAYYLDDTCLRD